MPLKGTDFKHNQCQPAKKTAFFGHIDPNLRVFGIKRGHNHP